jgi:cytosine/adenosine deaminase-related metal-dependent hydrolase
MLAKARKYRGDEKAPKLIDHRDVIEFATRRAAEAVGLGDQIGTLTPGKYADIIAIRAEDLNNMPMNNAIGTIALATESRNIDMVFVAGSLRKWRGELIGQDIDALRKMVRDSRDYVASRVGFEIRPTRHIRLEHDEIQQRHKGSFSAIDDLLTRGT